MPDTPTTQLVRVARRVAEADGVVSLDLVAADTRRLAPFTAGAHVDVTLPGGITRQYSLCNDPAERDRYRLGVLLSKESRGGSLGIHELTEGDVVTVSVPRDNFPLDETAAHSLLVAGGIGITPMMSMAHRLAALGGSFALHYCARSYRRAAFVQELCQEGFGHRVWTHFDDDRADLRFLPDRYLAEPGPDTHLYVCGPTGFMDFVLAAARERGWREDRVHREYFTAEVDTGGSSFTVRTRRSGLTLTVPEDRSIADVLADHGVTVPLSCEQGVCGTCLTPVLEGEPDHRDLYLSDAEKQTNKEMTVCCSRSHSPELLLDI
ncbi:PDR/VanB family oxidoreductase [Actinocorallia sp. A-T 12471]|uniref:PDR/VanB family oxidoreductase n=1 Tax=Actinocorallia sp. A-T 12471 TaxID=3089813 RepID=UPI0029D2B666|nr:PDR/VanB family oxidoreductase [Actinocorallia sp. A-T 12471]MDX6740617.1 PDR/VanB family oxidoreductase [Actinocorallia sp. A-T 12471]